MHKRASTKDCAVCYVADADFLFPSIASALSLRRFVSAEQADVLLFLTGKAETDADFPALRTELASLGIQLFVLSDDKLRQVDRARWSQGHVSLTTLGRFLIADQLARSHQRMLYIDGDTLFDADPTELLAYDVPEGRIGAVDDIRWFARRDRGRFGRDSRGYFSDLGIGPDQGYFNGGVLMVRTRTWKEMAAEALRYFFDNTERCKRHDQSAMNAALGNRRITLPIRWNFQTDYENLRLARQVRPAICHFTGTSKPWFGPLTPWEEKFPFYLEVEKRIGHLVPRPDWPAERVVAQNAVTRRLSLKMHILFAPRVFIKRRRILADDRRAERAFAKR